MVQALDLRAPTEWETLAELPADVGNGAFVEDGDDLVLVNPHGGNILLFDETSLTFSVFDDQTVPFPSGSLVLAVNDLSLHQCT